MTNDFTKKAEPIRAKLKIRDVRWVNEDEDYGIYVGILMEYDASLKTGYGNTINFKGKIPYPLRKEKVYVIYLEGSPDYNQKYNNYTYTINRFENEQLTLPEEQFEFLATVTPRDIYLQLDEQYRGENIIDLIFEDKIDLTKIKGLKEISFENLKEKLQLYRDLGKLQSMLRPLGVSISSIKKIAKHFGSPETAHYKLEQNLYNMCEVKGFGFTKVDEIALKGGVDPRDEMRIKFCLGYILEQCGQEGHSYMYRSDMIVQATDYLKIEPSYVINFLDSSEYNKGNKYHFQDVIVVGDMVSTFGMYWDERNTLNHLDRIMDTYQPPEFIDINKAIADAEFEAGFKYTDEQVQAIKECLNTGVYIIEGKSGTGKTSLVKAIINIMERVGVQTIGATLSGKASQVLMSKGVEASTIHRLLGYDGTGFRHNADEPISYKSVNLDEAGMNSANIWSSVLQALPDGVKLLITGDSGQIPSIGAGDILRDVLASNRYPKTELKQIHRQAKDSGVIEVAHKIRDGIPIVNYGEEINQVFGVNQDLQIVTMSKPKKDEVIINSIMTEEQIKEAQNPIYSVAKSVIESKIMEIKYLSDKDERERQLLDFQVICPTKSNGALSVDSINSFTQKIYNDNPTGITKGKTEFKKDDKVIVSGNKYKLNGYASIDHYIKNQPMEKDYSMVEHDSNSYEEYGMFEPEREEEDNYEKFDLFNGTVGIIKEIFPTRKTVLIKFEGVNALIPIHEDDFDALDLAYAYSIHKSQGSSIPNLLVLFDFGAFKLLSKQLVYTAITRTSGKCILLCENNALLKSISTDASGLRRTFMSLFLQHLDSQEQNERA